MSLLEMYRRMVLIREAELALARLFAENRLPGFIHSYVGEEATAVGVCSALRADDYVTSTHRGHGHVLAKGGDLRRFFAEVCGKAIGYCQGKGGSMHVTDLDIGILGANGIVGAGIPIAAGAALASKLQGANRVSIAFFGDGAVDTGIFHEALHLASLWDVPAVFVCENNGYTEFTPRATLQRLERISDRVAAYSVPALTVDGSDVEEVHSAAVEAVERARGHGGPTFLECVTSRWRGHYEGDPQHYRPRAEVEESKQRDPLGTAATRLRSQGLLDDDQEERIREETISLIEEAIAFAEGAPLPRPADALTNVYADSSTAG